MRVVEETYGGIGGDYASIWDLVLPIEVRLYYIKG